MDLRSEITCPYCNSSKTEVMPVDYCQFFYECENCQRVLHPRDGDCCVFCSFGSVKCPPVQLANSGYQN
ncbi:MAG: GDCCVxC domain-containing (seleno)protein [Pyrinomonadaceae bacterium]